MEIDNSFSQNSNPPRRFFLERVKDETGVSRTGRVLEGVLWQNGEVTVQWRPPMSTGGFYHSMQEFLTIHVDCHPSCNVVRWIDREAWHCFDCGAGGAEFRPPGRDSFRPAGASLVSTISAAPSGF